MLIKLQAINNKIARKTYKYTQIYNKKKKKIIEKKICLSAINYAFALLHVITNKSTENMFLYVF
jgi:hypothetical protein